MDFISNEKFSNSNSASKKLAHKTRTPWSDSEDSLLIELVGKFGFASWTSISESLEEQGGFRRSGKQCRERYHNHLDSRVVKDSWSVKEEQTLFACQSELGNKWSEIAKYLPGRTDNSIKNHFYSMLRKFIRKLLRTLAKSEEFAMDAKEYNPENVYKLVKAKNLPFHSLSKDTLLQIIKEDALTKTNSNFNSHLDTEHELSAIDGEELRTKGKQEATKFVYFNEDELGQLLRSSPSW